MSESSNSASRLGLEFLRDGDLLQSDYSNIIEIGPQNLSDRSRLLANDLIARRTEENADVVDRILRLVYNEKFCSEKHYNARWLLLKQLNWAASNSPDLTDLIKLAEDGKYNDQIRQVVLGYHGGNPGIDMDVLLQK